MDAKLTIEVINELRQRMQRASVEPQLFFVIHPSDPWGLMKWPQFIPEKSRG